MRLPGFSTLPSRLTVLSALLLVVAPAFAAQRIESGPDRTALLELYTSEGCSSCPPADRWVSSLEARPELWKSFVPIAFHVDYWDYIGWKDRFARPRFGARQRQYADEGGLDVVYTPGLVLNGKEWRRWRQGALPIARGDGEPGRLTILAAEDTITIEFAPATASAADLDASVAWLGFDLESDVSAGENRGRRLSHDFVVLKLESMPLRQDGDRYTARLDRPADIAATPRLALAAWVSAAGAQTPLQAAGGWIREAEHASTGPSRSGTRVTSAGK